MEHKKLQIFESVCKRLLREAQAPDLGATQFSPQRIDDADKTEKNTRDEELLFNDIDTWVRTNRITPSAVEQIKALMSHPKYSEFFKPVTSGILYRGIRLSREKLASMLGVEEITLPRSSSPVSLPGSLVPIKSSGASSWTFSREEAGRFAGEDKKVANPDIFVSVVFTAHAEDNPGTFLNLVGVLSRLKGFSKYLQEEEALALGPITGAKVEWSTPQKLKISSGPPASLGSKIKANLAAMGHKVK